MGGLNGPARSAARCSSGCQPARLEWDTAAGDTWRLACQSPAEAAEQQVGGWPGTPLLALQQVESWAVPQLSPFTYRCRPGTTWELQEAVTTNPLPRRRAAVVS